MTFPALPKHLFMPPDDAPSDVHFRLATTVDFRSLHDTCYSGKPFSQFRSYFQRMFDWQGDGRCCWLIATDKTDQIVANGQLILYPHGAELANLSVVPNRQGEGIGTAMIRVLTAVARHLNLPDLEIGVAVRNGRALALYRQLGFKEERHFHPPDGEPSIILRKDL